MKTTETTENDITLSVDTENLAVPEVHTGLVFEDESPKKHKKPHIHIKYDTAVPEIEFDTTE